MSFLDKAKRALGQAKGRAGALAGQHGDKIDHAIDKGGRYLDRRTSGKYSDKIHKGSDAAKRAATNLADQHRNGNQTASTPIDRPAPLAADPPAADPLVPDPNREGPNRP